MQTLWNCFGLVYRVLDPSPEDSKFDVTESERDLYEKIVRDFLHYCKARELTKVNPVKKQPVIIKDDIALRDFAVVFRNSASWRDVESQLNRMEVRIANERVRAWYQSWKTRISQIRAEHNLIHDLQDQLSQCRDIKKRVVQEASRDILEKEEKALKYKIEESNNKIKQIISEGETDLIAAQKNQELNSFLVCREIIEYMVNNWLNLCVFSEWSEVPMDVSKTFVRVMPFSKEEFDPILIKSISAVFWAKERELVQEVANYQTIGLAYTRTKGVNLTDNAEFGPTFRKRSSQIKLTRSLFFGVDFGNKDKVIEPIDPKSRIHVTDKALRLEKITQFAIRQVNTELELNQYPLDDEKINVYKIKDPLPRGPIISSAPKVLELESHI